MSIKAYQSKEGKKLYEVYVGVKARGKILQKRRRKDFQGNFISSLPKAKKVEFELKRQLVGQRDGQPIWKWKDWLEECLRRMRFSLKNSTIMGYETILGKWIPKDWAEEELQRFTKAEIHKIIFEDMFHTTAYQKKNFHKMLKRIFEMAIEEGVLSKNPVKGIKITLPAPKQQVLTAQEANKLLKEAKICNHRFYFHWAVALFTGMRNGEIYALRVSDVDLDAGIIHASKQFTSKDGLHETKTNLSRVVPIADELRPLLKWLMSNGYKANLWKWKNDNNYSQVFAQECIRILPSIYNILIAQLSWDRFSQMKWREHISDNNILGQIRIEICKFISKENLPVLRHCANHLLNETSFIDTDNEDTELNYLMEIIKKTKVEHNKDIGDCEFIHTAINGQSSADHKQRVAVDCYTMDPVKEIKRRLILCSDFYGTLEYISSQYGFQYKFNPKYCGRIYIIDEQGNTKEKIEVKDYFPINKVLLKIKLQCLEEQGGIKLTELFVQLI